MAYPTTRGIGASELRIDVIEEKEIALLLDNNPTKALIRGIKSASRYTQMLSSWYDVQQQETANIKIWTTSQTNHVGTPIVHLKLSEPFKHNGTQTHYL